MQHPWVRAPVRVVAGGRVVLQGAVSAAATVMVALWGDWLSFSLRGDCPDPRSARRWKRFPGRVRRWVSGADAAPAAGSPGHAIDWAGAPLRSTAAGEQA